MQGSTVKILFSYNFCIAFAEIRVPVHVECIKFRCLSTYLSVVDGVCNIVNVKVNKWFFWRVGKLRRHLEFVVLLSLTSVEDFIRLQYTAGITSYTDTVSWVFRYFHVIQWCLHDCNRLEEIFRTDKNHSFKKKCIPFFIVDKISSNKKLCLLFLSVKWRVYHTAPWNFVDC